MLNIAKRTLDEQVQPAGRNSMLRIACGPSRWPCASGSKVGPHRQMSQYLAPIAACISLLASGVSHNLFRKLGMMFCRASSRSSCARFHTIQWTDLGAFSPDETPQIDAA
jgi:hypothetical protein